MSSVSAVFLLLSLLLFYGIQAEARDFPGLSCNNEVIVVDIGGGRISTPPALPSSLTTPSSPSSIFEILSGIIRWFMSQAPTEQQQVVDQINCENDDPENPCNHHPSPVMPSSPSLHATPCIPRPPHETLHPSPILPSIISISEMNMMITGTTSESDHLQVS